MGFMTKNSKRQIAIPASPAKFAVSHGQTIINNSVMIVQKINCFIIWHSFIVVLVVFENGKRIIYCIIGAVQLSSDTGVYLKRSPF